MVHPAAALRPFGGGENGGVVASAGEEDLVELARRGRVDAYEALVRLYQDLAGRTAYAILGDQAEAQDAAQEAFVKAYLALSRFRPGAPFRPWLLRIVANEALNRARSARRLLGVGLRPDREPEARDPEPTPEAAAVAREQQHELVAAVNRLRPDDRLLIAYRYWLELPEAEMAQALGCARGTVKSRLSRALGRLRLSLAAVGEADPHG